MVVAYSFEIALGEKQNVAQISYMCCRLTCVTPDLALVTSVCLKNKDVKQV